MFAEHSCEVLELYILEIFIETLKLFTVLNILCNWTYVFLGEYYGNLFWYQK